MPELSYGYSLTLQVFQDECSLPSGNQDDHSLMFLVENPSSKLAFPCSGGSGAEGQTETQAKVLLCLIVGHTLKLMAYVAYFVCSPWHYLSFLILELRESYDMILDVE